MRTVCLTLAAALSLSSAAFAQPSGGSSLGLRTARETATRTVIDGASWTCVGQACVAVTQGRSQPVLRACQRVAARLGAVTAFTYNGRVLPADQLTTCNARARG